MLHKAANRAPGSAIPLEDAVQEARLAFVQYLDSFEHGCGVSLGAYLRRCAIGSVINSAGKYQSGFRMPHASLTIYWRSIEETDTLAEAEQYAESKGLSRHTFVDIHNALRGVVTMDNDRSRDDYSGEFVEADTVEAQVVADWQDDEKARVWEAVDDLSEKQHEALMLSLDGLNTVQMGKALGISQAAAHRRLQTAKERLRDALA